ncbi:Alcohol dehydrogenase [uncultured virus]|nr:Alcohol dehydrogenase [uncultured virus]
MNLKPAVTPDEFKFQSERDNAFRISHQARTELKKPSPFQGPVSPVNVNTNPIEAIGYGNLRKEYPLERMLFQRRAPLPEDIIIEILYCGVCHSDWHVNRDEWRNSKFPIITGHEIVGRVVKIGNKVIKFKVGDLAALGPNYDSCKQCDQCAVGFEQYCKNDVTETYNMPERLPGEIKATGQVIQGGYSNVIVVNQRYALNVPPQANLPKLAPVLCAGAIMYTPLKYCGLPSGARIGIAGFGGLGNIGLKLAKAMGYEVIVLTTSPAKLQDAITLGADQALVATDLTVMDAYRLTFDMIICTIPFRHEINMYIDLLKPQGIMWVVGAMLGMTVDFDTVNRKGRIVKGSSTAGIPDTQECINLCVQNNIYPDIQLISISDLNSTHERIVNKEVRYRYVVDMSTIYQ